MFTQKTLLVLYSLCTVVLALLIFTRNSWLVPGSLIKDIAKQKIIDSLQTDYFKIDKRQTVIFYFDPTCDICTLTFDKHKSLFTTSNSHNFLFISANDSLNSISKLKGHLNEANIIFHYDKLKEIENGLNIHSFPTITAYKPSTNEYSIYVGGEEIDQYFETTNQ